MQAGSGYLSQSSAALWFPRAGSPITAVAVVWPGGVESRVEQGLDAPTVVVRHP